MKHHIAEYQKHAHDLHPLFLWSIPLQLATSDGKTLAFIHILSDIMST